MCRKGKVYSPSSTAEGKKCEENWNGWNDSMDFQKLFQNTAKWLKKALKSTFTWFLYKLFLLILFFPKADQENIARKHHAHKWTNEQGRDKHGGHRGKTEKTHENIIQFLRIASKPIIEKHKNTEISPYLVPCALGQLGFCRLRN